MTDASLILPRRKFLTGLAALIAAPAIVKIDNLMALPRPPIIKLVSFDIESRSFIGSVTGRWSSVHLLNFSEVEKRVFSHIIEESKKC